MALTVTLPTPADVDNPTQAEIWSGISAVFSAISEVETKVDEIHTTQLGSWTWDKSTGILTMLDTLGVETFRFQATDTASQATRERRTDLE